MSETSKSLKYDDTNYGMIQYTEAGDKLDERVGWMNEAEKEVEAMYDLLEGYDTKAAQEKYATAFGADKIHLSREIKIGAGRMVQMPITDALESKLETDEQRKLLNEEKQLYLILTGLESNNVVAQYYVAQLGGETEGLEGNTFIQEYNAEAFANPYAWRMTYGLKAPIFTREDYQELGQYMDLEAALTTPPTKEEMLKVAQLFGYTDRVKDLDQEPYSEVQPTGEFRVTIGDLIGGNAA